MENPLETRFQGAGLLVGGQEGGDIGHVLGAQTELLGHEAASFWALIHSAVALPIFWPS